MTTPQPETRSAEEDRAWAAQAQAGDLVAFNAIVERYQGMAYNLALRMLRDPSAAEDATQEAFFSAYRNIQRYRGGSLRSWLLTIVANRARDMLRSPERRRGTSLNAILDNSDPGGTWADPSPEPSRQAEQAEVGRVVRRAVDGLPDDQRILVTLVDLQGLDYEEASRVTGASLGTVKSRLFRARQRLKESLQDSGLELPGAEERQD